MAVTAERIGTVAGVVAPAIALGAILVAVVLSPTFTWTENALSDLGASQAANAALFNSGLVLGGVVSLPFAVRITETARNRIEAAGAVVFALTAVALALVGLFPTGTDPHVPAAVAFYVLLSFSLWTYGVGNALAGDLLIAAGTVLLGVVNVGAWAVYIVEYAPTGLSVALPEIVGAVVLAVWTIGTAVRVWNA